ncbi:MAG: hypothetical protein ABSB67_06620, partial [Bryobacteraceae bacterium]
RQDLTIYPGKQRVVERIKFLLRRLLDFERVLATWAGAFQAACAVLLVRNALLFAARFRHQTIPEILPDGPVFFQVDQDADFAAFIIGDKLDAAHCPVLPQMDASAHRTLNPLPGARR